jgi:prophage regulatory protein
MPTPQQKKTASNDIPMTGLLRLPQVLRLVPVSASTWWSGCKTGRFPKPLHLSRRVTAWRGADVQRVIDGETDFS